MSEGTAKWILLCPLRSWYNDHDRPRLLKPNIQHGARIFGPEANKNRLVILRRWQDELVNLDDLPRALRDRLANPPPGDDEFFTADELRALGMVIPKIPTKGFSWWWWKMRNDAGAV